MNPRRDGWHRERIDAEPDADTERHEPWARIEDRRDDEEEADE